MPNLTEAECLEIGGHCFEEDIREVTPFPPVYYPTIYHRICKHCGLVEEGRQQPSIVWTRDSYQPDLKK